MKLCKICKQENKRKKSTCSYECELKAFQEAEKRKKEKAFAKKMEAADIKKLKAKAWKTFSDYIRQKYADAQGNCKCVTCGKVDSWKKMHAGHAVSGRGGRVLFDEKIVRPQCFYCNVIKGGRYDDFIYYLVEQEKSLTIDAYWKIKKESQIVYKLTKQDYEDIIVRYSLRLTT